MSTTSSTLAPSSPTPRTTPFPLAIILSVALLAFFFTVFFSIYFCKCINGWYHRSRNSNASTQSNGMDPQLIEIFPTFTYSAVTRESKEKHDLECVICLTEVKEEDLIRLITVCYHCFHKECIDRWLESHKTCPVCRRHLELSKETLENMTNSDSMGGDRVESALAQSAAPQQEVAVAIDAEAAPRSAIGNVLELEAVTPLPHAYARSHTTGHSLVDDRNPAERREYDKYTLRVLPELMAKIGGHNTSLSCTAIVELSQEELTRIS